MKDYSIVLAADLPSIQDVVDIAKSVGQVVDGIKLAAATLIESGMSAISQVRDVVGDIPILIDLKIADIGFLSGSTWDGTNAKIIRASISHHAATRLHPLTAPFLYLGHQCDDRAASGALWVTRGKPVCRRYGNQIYLFPVQVLRRGMYGNGRDQGRQNGCC